MPISKIISAGSFYYAYDTPWDLSSRLSVRLSRATREPYAARDIGTFDERFVWNEYIVRSLLDFRSQLDGDERVEFDRCQFVVRPLVIPHAHTLAKSFGKILAIQGYVGVATMGLPAPPTNGTPAVATLALISRLGWKRAGTRFNTRGVDDDGNTANFVEVSYFCSSSSMDSKSKFAADRDNLQYGSALRQLCASAGKRPMYVSFRAPSIIAFKRHVVSLQCFGSNRDYRPSDTGYKSPDRMHHSRPLSAIYCS